MVAVTNSSWIQTKHVTKLDIFDKNFDKKNCLFLVEIIFITCFCEPFMPIVQRYVWKCIFYRGSLLL